MSRVALDGLAPRLPTTRIAPPAKVFASLSEPGGDRVTGSFSDYPMPRADDLCPPSLGTHNVPTKGNPLGVKGGAETGTVGIPPAIMSAILDALRPLGVADLPMPATPDRVWRAIRHSQLAGSRSGEMDPGDRTALSS